MTTPDFEPIADAFRREVIAYYDRRGETLDGPAGYNTLETNSGFAERRGRPLLEILARRGGVDSLDGLELLDVGCGFGALAVYFASRGATVTGVDPNPHRLTVGRSVAGEMGLRVELEPGRAEALEFPDGSFDVVVMNNSLCYVVDPDDRRAALDHALRVLRPGGWLVVRNPNRTHPLDQFSGLPALHTLPPRAATRIAASLGRPRSAVRLVRPATARRELRRAGFELVAYDAPGARGWRRPFARLARYQHLTGRRPGSSDELRSPAGGHKPLEAAGASSAAVPEPALHAGVEAPEGRPPARAGTTSGNGAGRNGRIGQLLIGGCPRSGMSALARLLNQDSRIIVGQERFRRARRQLTPAHFDEATFFAPTEEETSVLRPALYRKLRRKWSENDVAIIGDRFAQYAYVLPELAERLPDAKFVVVLRDLERVASSFNGLAADPDSEWPADDDYRVALRHWNKTLGRVRTFVEEHGGADRLFVVRHEQLFSGDRRVLEALYGFLALELPGDVAGRHAAMCEGWQRRQAKPLLLDDEMRRYLAEHKREDLEAWALERAEAQLAVARARL